MIKPVKIPEIKQSQLQCLYHDIKTAIDNGITEFEIIGENYNQKYLAQYAKEAALKVTRDVIKNARRKAGLPEKFITSYQIHRLGYITVSYQTIDGQRHTYCKIRPEAVDECLENGG